jgi:hypothetical protein
VGDAGQCVDRHSSFGCALKIPGSSGRRCEDPGPGSGRTARSQGEVMG